MLGTRGARPSEDVMRRTMFSTSRVHPRWVTGMSFSGLTRLNCARTFSGGTMNVAQASRLPIGKFKDAAGTAALLGGRDETVVTTGTRASAGIRFKAKLQPTHPAPFPFRDDWVVLNACPA